MYLGCRDTSQRFVDSSAPPPAHGRPAGPPPLLTCRLLGVLGQTGSRHCYDAAATVIMSWLHSTLGDVLTEHGKIFDAQPKNICNCFSVQCVNSSKTGAGRAKTWEKMLIWLKSAMTPSSPTVHSHNNLILRIVFVWTSTWLQDISYLKVGSVNLEASTLHWFIPYVFYDLPDFHLTTLYYSVCTRYFLCLSYIFAHLIVNPQ